MASADEVRNMTDEELIELFESKEPTIEIPLEEYKTLKKKADGRVIT